MRNDLQSAVVRPRELERMESSQPQRGGIEAVAAECGMRSVIERQPDPLPEHDESASIPPKGEDQTGAVTTRTH